MTDKQVLDAVARAKRAHRTAETKAQRKAVRERKKVHALFSGAQDDVGRAARHNQLHRIDAVLDADLAIARVRLVDSLEETRARAGEWAELVPLVR